MDLTGGCIQYEPYGYAFDVVLFRVTLSRHRHRHRQTDRHTHNRVVNVHPENAVVVTLNPGRDGVGGAARDAHLLAKRIRARLISVVVVVVVVVDGGG